MKIAIIIPNIIDSTPYVKNFTDVFDRIGAEYEFICWNRNELKMVSKEKEKKYVFNHPGPESNSLCRKIYDYWLFSRFVIKCLSNTQYDYLTVHTIVCGFFLNNFLKNNFEGRYVFDIRDYSPITPFINKQIEKLIRNSSFSVISSNGYKKWLPQKYDYILGHNVRKKLIENTINNQRDDDILPLYDEIRILTIGQIRDFESNSRIIDSFGNKNKIKLIFAGSGLEKEKLEKFSKERYSNIYFTGRYQKNQEKKIVENSDFINIVLPSSSLFRTQMSNRFYLSLVSRKPMIVNSESIQARFVKKYKLGIVVNSTDDIYDKLTEYIREFDKNVFDNGCEEMIANIFQDINNFEDEIIKHFV